jgi:hypothetical protein
VWVIHLNTIAGNIHKIDVASSAVDKK